MNWKRVAAWNGGWISGIAYETLKDNFFSVFLIGENGVGKDTILHILKDAKFKSHTEPTKRLAKKNVILLPNYITIINTSGSSKNDDENIKARKELPSGKDTKYVYVFRVDKFFSDESYQKRVKWDINNSKEQCARYEKDKNGYKNGWDLAIIGTHRDKCNAGDEQIEYLVEELSEYGKFKCKILDLTKAKDNGKEMQKVILELLKEQSSESR